jgi:hypothetical protein
MKHFLFRYYGWIALIAFVLVGILAAANGKAIDWRIFLLSLGAILSFVYFMQRQKLEELNLFKELFTEFNGRYNQLNEGLNDIIKGDPSAELSKKERDLLYDYFNLCGEEYLFYQQGYIYPEVWKAWRNGMQIYFRNERIKKLWSDEFATDSYYGLRLD